jgi:hypothetical protein
MNTDLSSQVPAARSISGEGWAAIAGAIGSAFLLAKKLLSPKPPKPDLLTRADFYAELVVLKDQMHAHHLALLDKLGANQHELMAALERLATRCSALEAGFARLDERTKPDNFRRAQVRPLSGSRAPLQQHT